MIARLLSRERLLLAFLVALQGAGILFLVAGRRLPRVHDTFAYYVSQYLVQCHSSTEGEVPLWAGYASHGRTTGPELLRQASLLQGASLALGGLPEGTPFAPWFYASIWLEEILLLAGLWRLGVRFGWAPVTRAIVCAAGAGTNLWVDQILDHRLLCFLPLAMSLLHDVLDGGPHWKLHALLGWMALNFFGGSLYGAFFGWLALLVYGIVHLRGRFLLLRNSNLRFRAWDAAAAALFLLLILATVATAGLRSSDVHLEREGRGAHGEVALDNYLTHGLSLHPARYLDLVAGVSPSLDFTLYLGVPAAAFALLALVCRPGGEVRTLLWCLGLSLFFSLGVHSWIAFAAYFGFPPMMYFRHVASGSVLVRLFLLLLAGHGVEAWIRGRADTRVRNRLAWGAGGLAAALGGFALLAAAGDSASDSILAVLRTPMTMYPPCPETQDAGRMAALLAGAAAAAAGTMVLLRRPPGLAVAAALLLLVAADAQRWRFQMILARTTGVTAEAWEAQRIRPVPFSDRRRMPSLEDHRSLFGGSFEGRGSAYDFLAGYLGVDFTSTSLSTGHWQNSVERLRSAVAPRPAGSAGSDRHFFPRPSPGLRKVLGEGEGKLRLFSRAYGAPSDGVLARWLADPRFDGDSLILDPAFPARLPPGGTDLPSGGSLESAPRVLSAGANRLVVEVTAPEGAWLAYADAWHPNWSAEVNGKPVPVERAYLAYKAVRLDAGPNRVEFRYRNPGQTLGFKGVAGYCLLCLVGLAAWGAQALRRTSPS